MSRSLGKAFWEATSMWKGKHEPKFTRFYKEQSSSYGVCCDMTGNCRGSNKDGAYYALSLVMPLEKLSATVHTEFCFAMVGSTGLPSAPCSLNPHSLQRPCTYGSHSFNQLATLILLLFISCDQS